MNITQFSIEKKRIIFTLLFVIFVTGLTTYINMPRAEDPGFVIKNAVVLTYFPGASPERIEQLITDKLEKKIQEMPELDNIMSQSKPGLSILYVNIQEKYRVMRPIWDNLRRKVEAAKSDLPSGIFGPFVNDEFGDVFGTQISITGEGYSYAELKQLADECRNELLLIPEAAKVEISGAQDERVFIDFNNARLAELGISPGQLNQILKSRNIIFPGGEIFTDDEQIILEPSGNFESVEELKRTIIKLPQQRNLIYLGDIAHIYRSYVDPPAMRVTHNGEPALVLGVSMREGGNIIVLGEEIQKKVDRFKEVYPIGVDFKIIYSQPYYVQEKIDEFTNSLLQAIAIVIAVMLIFLGVRTGLIISSLIPMSILMSIMVMGFFSIGLDQMTIAALIISLGLLVDNAIVMSESIMVNMSEGKKSIQAAIASAKELRIPLLTSSLTTAAAFLPIYLAESSTGEYAGPIFKVVAITLICSWILSLTMTPLMCVLFLRVKKQGENYSGKFYFLYRNSLLTLLKHPILSIVGTFIIFYGALQLTPYIPSIFFPLNDKPVMYAEFRLPVGTPLAKTEKMIYQVEDFLKHNMMAEFDEDGSVVKDGVINWTSFIGSGAPRFYLSLFAEQQSPEYAYVKLNVTDRSKMDTDFIPAIESFCLKNFPDLNLVTSPLLLGPPVAAPVQIRVSGYETDEVFKLADEVEKTMASITGLSDIRNDWGAQTKKILVKINQARARRAGLTNQDIAISLQSILSGIQTTEYREGDESIPVILRSETGDRKDIGKLESHKIYVQATGSSVPLLQVADIEVAFQPSKILRRNRLKTVTVSAYTLPGYNAIALANEVDKILVEDSKNWPVGYLYELGGEIESSGQANESLGAKFPIAFLTIILLLVAQFDSIRRPLIILLTIPLGLIGVFIGLVITQEALGFMAILGVISLAGIVINNAIVLIDRIKIEIEEHGLSPADAILEAAQRRIRPILLTTATTVGGLIPLWLGGGAMFRSMAVAIIFGLLFATIFTLGFVPLMYRIFFRVSFKNYQEG
jgi:multidrug efflux pump subunit AcrB